MSADAVTPAELDIVLARWLRDTERLAANRLLLTFAPEAAPALCELAARMRDGMTVHLEDGQVLLEVTAPDLCDGLLEQLVVRAETADLRTLQRHRAA
ncbi:hypothetical protein [Pseudonocardia sp.]|jgi:hypothetical protein|uniref:hypothetical protein n=1 Tax=Pseudonocardia sp. TaxID=60912 RepID=UPI003D13069C